MAGFPNWANLTFRQTGNKEYQELYLSNSTLGITQGNEVDLSVLINKESNWSFYPALYDIQANNQNLYNVNNTNIRGYLRVEGNASAPYWNEIKLDGNITTGNIQTNTAPTCRQYFSSYNLYNTAFDLESPPTFAFHNAHLKLETGGSILPVGNVVLESKNYELLYPSTSPPFFGSGNYRGYLYVGVNGTGPEAYIRFNYDTLGQVFPNQGALVEINADSVLGVTTQAPSRVRTTAGKVDGLGTFANDQTAGTRLVSYPDYHATCKISQYAYGGITPIPDPTTGNAGEINIICDASDRLPIENTFGNAVVTIEAKRPNGNILGFSATVNIKAKDKINIDSYRTQIDTWELRLGTIGGTGSRIICDGWLEYLGYVRFLESVHMNNLDYCKGQYPDYLEGKFTQLSNLITSGSNTSNIYTESINTIDLSFSNLKSDVNCESHIFFSTLAMTLTNYSSPEKDQGSFAYSDINHPVLSNTASYMFSGIPHIVPVGNGIISIENRYSLYNTENPTQPYSALFASSNGLFSYSTFSNGGQLIVSKRIIDDWSIAPAVCDLNMNNYFINNVQSIFTHNLTTDYIRANDLGYTLVQNDLIFPSFNNIAGVSNAKSLNTYTNNLYNYGTSNISVYADLDLQYKTISNINNLQLSNINGVFYTHTSNWFKYQALNNILVNNNNIKNVNNLEVNTINNVLYESVGNWSKYTAVQDVYFDTHNIFGVTGINGVNNIQNYDNTYWSKAAAIQNVNIANYNLLNVGTLQLNGTTVSYNSSSNTLQYSNVANGIQTLATQKQVVNWLFSVNLNYNLNTPLIIASNVTLKANKSYMFSVSVGILSNTSNWSALNYLRLANSNSFRNVDLTNTSVTGGGTSAGSVVSFFTGSFSNFLMQWTLRNNSITQNLQYTMSTDLIEL